MKTVMQKEIILREGYNESGDVVVPDGVTTIGDHAFMHSVARTIKLPNTLKTIGYCSFSDCNNLRKIDIPEGVTHIGYGAFSGCTNLECISIPRTVASIRGDLFEKCGLKKIIVPLHLVYQASEETPKNVLIEVIRC